MSSGEQVFLIALVAFIAGVALGKFWSRLASGRPESSRLPGESLHYILGLDYLASHQIDRAVAELTRAAQADTEAIEIYLILGNLLREKGQLERAIQIHQSLLHRPGLTSRERAHTLLCLGIDFKRAGFRNRALSTFQEVLRRDSANRYALLHLLKIHEEEQDWEKALDLQQRVVALGGKTDNTLTAFLHDQLGQVAWAQSEDRSAIRNFETAMRLDRSIPPPYLHLGDLHEVRGRLPEATACWETFARQDPEHAYLVFERLERAYGALGEDNALEALFQEVIARDNKDWRAHLELARRHGHDGRTDESFELLLGAVENNPHAIAVHLAAWDLLFDDHPQPDRIRRYIERVRDAVLFLDPHICVKCHYRANGILWRCPHCQEWNTFVEERWTPRKQDA